MSILILKSRLKLDNALQKAKSLLSKEDGLAVVRQALSEISLFTDEATLKNMLGDIIEAVKDFDISPDEIKTLFRTPSKESGTPAVSITNFDELNDNLDRISSKLDIKIPEPNVNVTVPDFPTIPEPVVNFPISELIEALEPLQLLSRKANSPVTVRLSDGKKFITKLMEVVKAQEKTVQAFSQSPGMNKKEYLSASRALGLKPTATSNTKVTVAATTTSVVTANTDRVSLTLVNDSDETIYISKSGTAVMNEGIRLNANGGSLFFADYTGAVSAICSSGTKNLTVCEV